jgi:hypothetical protein
MLIKTCQINKNDDVLYLEDDENDDESEEPTLELNVFKYEILKMCIDRVLSDYVEDEDSNDLFKKDSTSLRIAMGTLIKNNILIELEEDYE